MTKSVLFINCFLFLLFHSAKSLTCGDQEVDYSNFIIKPHIVWDLTDQSISNAEVTAFKAEVSKQFNFAMQENGIRNFFHEGLNFADPSGESTMKPSLQKEIDEFEPTFYDDVIRPLLQNPPQFLKANSMTSPAAYSTDLIVKEIDREETTALRGTTQTGEKKVVHWLIIFTENNTGFTENGPFLAWIKTLEKHFPHVTVMTFGSDVQSLESQWKPSWLIQHLKANYLSVKKCSAIPASVDLQVPVLKQAVIEMNELVCSGSTVRRAAQAVQNTGSVHSFTEKLTERVRQFENDIAASVNATGDYVANHKGQVAAAGGGVVMILLMGGLSAYMCKSKSKTEKTSIVADDQDDWNNFSYEDGEPPKLCLDATDRQNSMEWIQLK